MGDFIAAATDRQNQIALLAAVATVATILTLVAPIFQTDPMKARAKRVADFKEDLKQKSRAELKLGTKSASLRNQTAKGMGKQLVEQFKLLEVFDAENARKQLVKAGWRGERPVFTFMLARLATPIIALFVGIFYIYVLETFEMASFMKLVACFGVTVVGYYLPQLYVTNAIKKRQQKVQLAFPDSLDLMLICVESGMSIEAAMQKVTEEVATTCPELAEEYGLTTAELSYLQDRKVAYYNLGERTGLEGIKAVTTALIQSEAYGTPLGSSLRVMAAENRELRMQAAEKKAAALPPKLTVPMILFFLPVLFVVILGPGVLTAMKHEKGNADTQVTTSR
ncbi:type II secretion system F family protein [Parvularcula sp. LCG005]|uniref:type II secretion system F family protein n=1 Tax=Parvularcula sp. LCG005 TaxID=3078805 RepID=UPI002942FD89|nr:type II secretion system F family protein [Parvularcula sp. LCG005]WOI53568.1 type II secretion system F family protein [Parvularcula sp. LCG005]